MARDIERELHALRQMTPQELQERYTEVFGERPRSRNKAWLVKRIAWRLQALKEGELSDRARHRAAELANDADLRTTAPRSSSSAAGEPMDAVHLPFKANHRLPMAGAVLTRQYKGRTITVTVLERGFEYEGHVYRSLTAVAKTITGSHWNGILFFGLKRSSK